MGLFIIRAKFQEEPPSEKAIREEMGRQMGSTAGLDSVVIRNRIVEVTTALNPVAVAYMQKVLMELGGEILHSHPDETSKPSLPEYVRKPWRDWPWWKRAGIHARFFLGLLSTFRLRKPTS